MSEGAATTPGVRVVNGRPVPEPGTWEIDPPTSRSSSSPGT